MLRGGRYFEKTLDEVGIVLCQFASLGEVPQRDQRQFPSYCGQEAICDSFCLFADSQVVFSFRLKIHGDVCRQAVEIAFNVVAVADSVRTTSEPICESVNAPTNEAV